jgi:hypothetical protein
MAREIHEKGFQYRDVTLGAANGASARQSPAGMRVQATKAVVEPARAAPAPTVPETRGGSALPYPQVVGSRPSVSRRRTISTEGQYRLENDAGHPVASPVALIAHAKPVTSPYRARARRRIGGWSRKIQCELHPSARMGDGMKTKAPTRGATTASSATTSTQA